MSCFQDAVTLSRSASEIWVELDLDQWLGLVLTLSRYGGWTAQRELWSYLVDRILIIHDSAEAEPDGMGILMQ